jgi:hypothetical protein
VEFLIVFRINHDLQLSRDETNDNSNQYKYKQREADDKAGILSPVVFVFLFVIASIQKASEEA